MFGLTILYIHYLKKVPISQIVKHCLHVWDKGLGLLKKAVTMLESEGRPAQAGSLALKMVALGLELEAVGPEMVDIGRAGLRMFVLTNNEKMTGSCLLLLTLLLARHFENVAAAEVRQLLQDNLANISEEAQELVREILQSLEAGDLARLHTMVQSYSSARSDTARVTCVVSALTSARDPAPDPAPSSPLPPPPVSPLVTRAGAGSSKFPRVLTVAAGAALVASSVGAATRTRTGLKKELR